MSSARVMLAGVGAFTLGLVGACTVAPEPAGPCAALAALDLIDMRIVSAETVAAGDAGPAHCRVSGVIDTEINFELLLPDEWNGRFMMGGGGGYVGSVQNAALSYGLGDGALERGYATVGTDTGHTGSGIEAGWALDNPERQENFGHRAVRVTAEAAKSIIRHYYDQTLEHSYFVGCSRGGGQGEDGVSALSRRLRRHRLWCTRVSLDRVHGRVRTDPAGDLSVRRSRSPGDHAGEQGTSGDGDRRCL